MITMAEQRMTILVDDMRKIKYKEINNSKKDMYWLLIWLL